MNEPCRDRTDNSTGFSSFRDWLAQQDRLPRAPRRGTRTRKAPVHKKSDRPNVLWLMADQLRADTFGFAGHPFIKTPNLDRLASQGAVLNRSYCTSPVCMPSRAGFMTGHYTETHGVLQNGYAVHADEVFFPNTLTEAGYRTANIGKVHNGRPGSAIWEHYEHVDDPFGATKPSQVPFDPGIFPELVFLADKVCDNSDRVLYGVHPGPVQTTKSYHLATRALKWLYWNDDERPFFLRVSFGDPHPPIIPPEPFASMYKPEQVPGDLLHGFRESLASKPRVIRDWSRLNGMDQTTEETHRWYAARYCGLVSHLDAQFGRILDYLDELGWADNTIVVVNSDHGNMIGEHGLSHKGSILYEGVCRIPTIYRWPGRIAPGTCIDALVDGVDFVPTILSMLNVPQPRGLHGHSILPLLDGTGETVREHAFVQWHDYGYAIVGRRYKLVWWDCDNDGELYDLREDPRERVNLFDHEPVVSIRNDLLSKLDAWRERYAHPRAAAPAGSGMNLVR